MYFILMHTVIFIFSQPNNSSGIRLFSNAKATDLQEAKALGFQRDHIDIYSNSWGPPDKGLEVIGPGHLTLKTLQDGALKVCYGEEEKQTGRQIKLKVTWKAFQRLLLSVKSRTKLVK